MTCTRTFALLLPATFACAQSAIWQRAPVLEPRSGQAMVWDAARGECLLFGGFQSGRYPETWSWDGVAWTLHRPANTPAGRRDHAMAYDSGRNRVVMFGGNGASGDLDETWEWDGFDWQQLTPAVRPSARDGQGMAYDAGRGVTVLFGGQGPLMNDTWEWDGVKWIQRTPTTDPGGHSLTAMVYDTVRQRIVMFGGSTTLGAAADTWEYDGVDWSAVTTPNQPPARQRHALAWDPDRGVAVLFGGSAGSTRFNDLWEYDGVDWTQIGTPLLGPDVRDRVGFAYDERHDDLVLFGGRGPTNSNNLGDTWEWDGIAWRARDNTLQPGPRAFHTLAADPAHRELVLFGGDDLLGPLADTWLWDGGAWRSPATAVTPPARTHAAMCATGNDRVLLFGGSDTAGLDLGDTWLWNGSGWQQATTAVAPPQRTRHGLAFDVARGRSVLFGGLLSIAPVALNDTWEWDGGQWLAQTPATPPSGRQDHALAYDAARGVTVLFGGGTTSLATLLTDTWEWNGSNWLQRVSATTPPARAIAAAAFDARLDRLVVFGGVDATGTPLADTWEWDGIDWSANAAAGPSARSGMAMAFDAIRGRPFAVGGVLASGAVNGENWEFAQPDTAFAAPFGDGCGGNLGVPELLANGAPGLGNATFALELGALVPGALALIALGFDRDRFDLGGGCTLLVANAIGNVVVVADGAGAAAQPIAIPNSTPLLGVRAFAQGFGLDVTGPLLGQATATRGLELRLGR
ncbi:MAG: hypothetical protein KDE27_25465 [Planctomycetes bacterium]|nr:hypothetical protein [Planctomycetota bacterium]